MQGPAALRPCKASGCLRCLCSRGTVCRPSIPALALSPGGCSYNMACCWAALGQRQSALTVLEVGTHAADSAAKWGWPPCPACMPCTAGLPTCWAAGPRPHGFSSPPLLSQAAFCCLPLGLPFRLQALLDNNFDDYAAIRSDPDLAPLRGPELDKLLAK